MVPTTYVDMCINNHSGTIPGNDPAYVTANGLVDLVRVIFDGLGRLIGGDLYVEALFNTEFIVEKRDSVLANGKLDIALWRLLTSVATINKNIARWLGA